PGRIQRPGACPPLPPRCLLLASRAIARSLARRGGRDVLILVLLRRRRRIRGVLVDAVFSERGEFLVGGFLFVERFFEQTHDFLVTERSGPRDQGAVRGHLIMLGALPSGDQARIHGGLVEILLHRVLAFFDDAGNAVAVLAAHLFA